VLPLRDVVAQCGNAAGLVAGLLSGDAALVSRSLADRIAEPHRKHLIPGYAGMVAGARESGALGCNISGSGPAVFALCPGETVARRAADAMIARLRDVGASGGTLISSLHGKGAHVVRRGLS